MTRASTRAAFAAVFAVALLSRADAPPDQYVSFNAANTFITDAKTHLIWTRATSAQKNDHATGLQICTDNFTRLPTYRELLSLVDESPHTDWDPEAGVATYRYIDPNAFPGTPGDAFWTMSPNANKNGFMIVDFGTGEAHAAGPTDTAYSRCVQDPQ